MRLVINSASAGKSHLGRSVRHLSEASASGLGGWGSVGGGPGCVLGAAWAPGLWERKAGACVPGMSLGCCLPGCRAADLGCTAHSPELQPRPDSFPTQQRAGRMAWWGVRRPGPACGSTLRARGELRFPALDGESEVYSESSGKVCKAELFARVEEGACACRAGGASEAPAGPQVSPPPSSCSYRPPATLSSQGPGRWASGETLHPRMGSPALPTTDHTERAQAGGMMVGRARRAVLCAKPQTSQAGRSGGSVRGRARRSMESPGHPVCARMAACSSLCVGPSSWPLLGAQARPGRPLRLVATLAHAAH